MPRWRAWLTAALLAAVPAGAAPAGVIALVGGRLVDGTGASPVANSVILIDGERITAVGQVGSLPVPDGAEVVSTEGLTVLPGLWDLDVRLWELGHGDRVRWDEAYLPLAGRVVMPAAAEALLHVGVTSVRDVGSPLEAALAVRERIRALRIPGPSVWVSGPVLEPGSATRGHGRRWQVAGVAEVRDKVARLAAAGVDYVLVSGVGDFSDAELAALDAAARAAGLPWHAEVLHDGDVARALDAGAAGLLGLGTDLAPALPAAALAALGTRAARNQPVPWTAAASTITDYEWLRENPEPLDDPAWRVGLPAIVAEDVRASLGALATLSAYETPALRRAALAPRLASARAAGARLLAGSGAGEPAHLQARATWQEIEALVLEGGLTPAAAIEAATLQSAVLMGADRDSGSVSPGKYADIIAVRGDPLRHIERLQDVQIVLRRGLRYR